jgi:hypothetical protein
MDVAKRLGGLALALSISGCGSSSSSATIPQGVWGALGIEMTVGLEGAAITFCCAKGQIPPPLTLDPSGSFDYSGTYIGMSGPIPANGYKSYPARYRGSMNGSTMILVVTTPIDSPRAFILTFGTHNTALCVCPL